LPARFGIDAPAAELLCEGLAPAQQIGLARVQAPAVPGFGSHAESAPCKMQQRMRDQMTG
jgi:hypothetical protein